jgi:restriction endonuclease, S subunit
MREGWEYKKFENCIVKSPKLKQVKKEAYNNGSQYPIISQEEKFISGYCDDESMVCHIDRPVVVFGDHTRVLKYIDFDFVVGADGVKVIIPIKSIDSKFLLYFLQWYNIPNLGYSRHYKLLKDVMVPIPNCTTQLSIVSELDKLNELIQIKKEQLKDYDTLAQSIFYEMFGDPVVNEKGWEMKTLGHICEITSSKRVFANEYVDTGVPFYRSKEVIEKSKQLSISVELYISESHYNKIKSSFGVPQIGDILVTAVGTIGKIWVVDTNEPFYFKDGNLVWLRNIKGAHCEYFRYSLFYLIDEYKKVNANGAAYNALTIAKLKLMLCPLPPLSLQQSFAHKIEQIERQKAAVQSTITDLETLLAVRMQYWFD